MYVIGVNVCCNMSYDIQLRLYHDILKAYTCMYPATTMKQVYKNIFYEKVGGCEGNSGVKCRERRVAE